MKQLPTYILLCASLAAGAQVPDHHRLDSLRIVISQAKNDTGKVKLLLTVGHAYLDVNVDETIRYARQAAELAEKLRDKKAQAKAYNQLGIAYNHENMFIKSLNSYNDELDLSRELNDKNSEGRALCNIGHVYVRLMNMNKAMDNFDQAKKILKETGNKEFLASTYTGIGKVHIKKMQYPDAIESYKKAYELYDTMGDKKGIANTCYELSWLYDQKAQYALAETNALRALEAAHDGGYGDLAKKANEMIGKARQHK